MSAPYSTEDALFDAEQQGRCLHAGCRECGAHEGKKHRAWCRDRNEDEGGIVLTFGHHPEGHDQPEHVPPLDTSLDDAWTEGYTLHARVDLLAHDDERCATWPDHLWLELVCPWRWLDGEAVLEAERLVVRRVEVVGPLPDCDMRAVLAAARPLVVEVARKALRGSLPAHREVGDA